jgi:squalene-hopene/tetraprenyl-beta-curcumene cyclase
MMTDNQAWAAEEQQMRQMQATIGLVLVGVVALGAVGVGRAIGPDPKLHAALVEKGIAYLKSTQDPAGTWSKAATPGITGIALAALLRNGVSPDDPVAAKALKYVESLATPEGHLAGKDAKLALHNYVTSVNVLALKAANRPEKYGKLIDNAVAYLKKLQWDESEQKTPADPYYGGAGYGKDSRPDLSNTNFFLDALKAAGVAADDPAFKKAAVYVSRCQNLKSEHNTLPWADKINDGSFIYGAAPEGDTRGEELPDGRRPGYGSMTFAGIKSLALCGVPRTDPRLVKAFEWITKNYSVDTNPGMPPGAGQRGYYYYLLTMARALETVGVNEVIDSTGRKHDWRLEVTQALAARQRKNGSWINETDRWLEGDPDLCTAYALLTLSHTRPVE